MGDRGYRPIIRPFKYIYILTGSSTRLDFPKSQEHPFTRSPGRHNNLQKSPDLKSTKYIWELDTSSSLLFRDPHYTLRKSISYVIGFSVSTADPLPRISSHNWNTDVTKGIVIDQILQIDLSI